MRYSRFFWLAYCLAGPLQASDAVVTAPSPAQVIQTLVKSNGDEPESLDPARVRSGFSEEAILTDLFEGLVNENGAGEVVPANALRWERSNDGLVWRFFLRPNLRWSNNTPLKASDYVYAWRRLIDPATASPASSLVMAAGINNASSIYAGALDVKELGVEAESDHILRVTLEHPVPYFLRLVSQRPFVPLYEPSVSDDPTWMNAGNLVSNGAYQLTHWVAHQRIELGRNANYWDNAHTRIDQVVYLPKLSAAAEREGYDAGDIQMTNRIQPDYYQTIKQTEPERVWGLPLLGTAVFSFNLQQREVADVRVRQALSMAIDREVLTQTVTRLGEPIAWSLLPALPGYQPYQPGESALPRSERLAHAAELLKAVGVGPDHPLHLVITYNTSGNHKRLAEAIALMWQPLGIETELRNLSWGDYQSAKSAGDFTVARSFVFGDYAEPSAVLNQFRCGDPQNESGYCDPQFDRLLTDAANTLDESLRNQFYQQAEQLMMSAQPVIPLFHYSQMRLISPQLRGLPTQNVRGVIASKDLYFAQQQ